MADRPKINAEDKTKDGDSCFSGTGNEAEVWATTQAQALELARGYFKPPKSKRHLVHVHLAERPGGVQVTHVADF